MNFFLKKIKFSITNPFVKIKTQLSWENHMWVHYAILEYGILPWLNNKNHILPIFSFLNNLDKHICTEILAF